MPQHLAVELLQFLLNGEFSVRWQKNIIQTLVFTNKLEQTLKLYQNRIIKTTQVIDDLIQLARDLREDNTCDDKLGFSNDVIAFYDALDINDNTVMVLGDEM